ncbi:MAG: sensor histidine kinase [Pseudomonas sp.]|uniref:HAMP domain-containing sensor histidine kinase n=1 Tax=Pseudomonas abieticivorans TaxID=2931382 RepID=UPI0020BE5AF3|nr:sensor histidine kinase [Pseudomonas sp. PIA16]MDE1168242.1 sensor histidine kinase [Pseudomonas sp.]
MPRRHSLLWKLAFLQAGFCLLLTWLIWFWGLEVERSTYFLDIPDRVLLADYAAQAEQVWEQGGTPAVDRWQAATRHKENTWVAVIGPHLESLSSQPLTAEQSSHLTFMRKLDWPMSRRLQDELPYVSIDFPRHPANGRVVLQLPERLLPAGLTPWTHVLTHGVVPALLAIMLGALLYRHLVAPLNELRERANALRADDLEKGTRSRVARRRDELGELAKAFDHMAERVKQSLHQQRQLLRTLSHEIRTPLTRLRVASESNLPPAQLQQRLAREVDDMQRLVDDALDLAWLDAERPQLPTEPVVMLSVWEALVQDACFETGWPPERLRCELSADCLIQAHLDSLAQAVENLLRNAIRHSPPDGLITLRGRPAGDCWLLQLEDQGCGVADSELERIFEPFLRLDGTPGKGFGLGLSIARRAIQLQGGELWASRGEIGLCMNLRLPRANV